MFFLALINVLYFAANLDIMDWRSIPLGVSEYVPVFTLAPRFILSMRALYAHDLRGRDIDTEFGLTAVPGRAARVSVIKFAAQSEVETSEQDEEIRMDDIGTWSAGTVV